MTSQLSRQCGGTVRICAIRLVLLVSAAVTLLPERTAKGLIEQTCAVIARKPNVLRGARAVDCFVGVESVFVTASCLAGTDGGRR
jgi:hypothetical protein